MTFYTLFGIPLVLWLMSMLVGVIAIRWKSFWPTVILSVLALVISWLGIRHFRVLSSRTVNDQVKWRFDSNWLFIAASALGVFALAHAIWKKRKPATPRVS